MTNGSFLNMRDRKRFLNETTMLNQSTTAAPYPRVTPELPNHAVAYIFIPLGSLTLVAVVAFVIMLIFRKNRMERLRHHLMPLYNFDPQEEDWESELLDDKGKKVYSKEMLSYGVLNIPYSHVFILGCILMILCCSRRKS